MDDDTQQDSYQSALEERSRILAIMRNNGLELSEDGSCWVSIQEDKNKTKRIDLPDEDETTYGDVIGMFCIVVAFFLLLSVPTADSMVPFFSCCSFLTLGCMIMLVRSEGKVGYTILKIMLILLIFGIALVAAIESSMGGGYGDFGLGGLSGWGGP